MSSSSLAFASRARAEAARYGSDPWVFVRELVQNSRDAGATRIEFEIGTEPGIDRIRCSDDGDGLTLQEARRYLFALYASSKRPGTGQAGRFGVGFWSILRFEPERIVIASASARGSAWAIELDGELSGTRALPPPRSDPGTTITLERPATDPAFRRRVTDAVRQSSRDLRQLRHPDRRIRLLVDGAPVDRSLSLPAPARRFARGSYRGVVGLGPAPGVELFSRGLRVRSAAVLSDLLGDGGTSRSRVRFPELVAGLAPCAQLEGGDLELTMARSDARETPGLRRLVRLAQREIGRLLEGQLDRADDRSRLRRALSPAARPAALAAAAATVILGLVATLPGALSPRDEGASLVSSAPPPLLPPVPQGYRDLSAAYSGPLTQDGHRSSHPAGPVRYAPPEPPLYLGALRISALDAHGRPTDAATGSVPARDYHCARECVDLELAVTDGPGPLRLPVPTGHAVESGSARFDGGIPAPLRTTARGEPLIRLPGPTRATLRYRTGPAPSEERPPRAPAAPAPEALVDAARRLSHLPIAERVPAAERWVAERVRYSLDGEIATRYRGLDQPFLERALQVGEGDCDVQNAVLLALLQRSGVDARLAIGYVGRDGRTLPDLHAWVELRDSSARWQVADASRARTPSSPLDNPPATRPSPVSARPLPLLGGAGAALLLGLLALAAARRGRKRPDTRVDLAAILRGALQRPQSFEDAPGVFHRPILRLVGGRRTTLARAWDLAHRGRLFLGDDGDGLSALASYGGGHVLDVSAPESCAVGEMLGAIPLQDWRRRLGRSRETLLTRRVSERLVEAGVPWDVRYAAPGDPPGALELTRSESPAARQLLIDSRCRVLASAERALAARPATALLAALTHVCDLLALAPRHRRRLLSSTAREALLES